MGQPRRQQSYTELNNGGGTTAARAAIVRCQQISAVAAVVKRRMVDLGNEAEVGEQQSCVDAVESS